MSDDQSPPHTAPPPPKNPWGEPPKDDRKGDKRDDRRDTATDKNPFGRRPTSGNSGGNPKQQERGPGAYPGARPGQTPNQASNQRPNLNAPPLNEFEIVFRKLSNWWSANRPNGPQSNASLPASRTIGIVAALLAAVWLGSGFYRVQEGQLGVVLRFGEVNRTAQPGLRYHLPYPFETALTPNVTFENRIEIGFRSGDASETNVPEESVMLTADQNIIDLNFAVTWIVKDATQFLFEIREPEVTVKRAAESAMREVVGQTDIQSALTDARDQIQQDTKTQLQAILDSYNSGIEIVRVELLRVNPPTQVVDAFNDVQRADADRERLRNEAEGYRNKIIPEARGEAERLRNEAEGYRQQVINAATGEASRFGEVQAAYSGGNNITRQVTAERLYLETMESVLRGKRKLVMDGKGTVPYLPLALSGLSGMADTNGPQKDIPAGVAK